MNAKRPGATRRPLGRTIAVTLTIVAAVLPAVAGEVDSATAPHSILNRPAEYRGPDALEPDLDLDEIPIGLFAPLDPVDSVGHRMWRGASLAVEEANAAGGYEGKPFRLVQRWAPDPWRGGGVLLTRMVYEDGVLGIIGGPDGASTHLAEQIATKVRVPILSPVSGDPSLTRVSVPWIFVLAPGEDAQARLLAGAVAGDGRARVVLVSSTDHDGRVGAEEVKKALLARDIPLAGHLTLPQDLVDAGEAARRTRNLDPDAVVLWAVTGVAERFLGALSTLGFRPALYLPMLREPLDPEAGLEDWPNAVCGLIPGATPASGDEPSPVGDWVACSTYDATTLLVAAVRKAGLNRARTRDGIAAMSGYRGLSGDIVWNNGGANTAFPLEVSRLVAEARP